MAPNTAQPASLVRTVLTSGPLASTGRFTTGSSLALRTMATSVPEPGSGATMLDIFTGLTFLPVIGDVTVEVMRTKLPSPSSSAQLMSSPLASVTSLASDVIRYGTPSTSTVRGAGISSVEPVEVRGLERAQLLLVLLGQDCGDRARLVGAGGAGDRVHRGHDAEDDEDEDGRRDDDLHEGEALFRADFPAGARTDHA